MTRRTTKLDAAGVSNRAAQARAFLESAHLHLGSSRADNSVAGTAAVHAGIAAADAICGKMLGHCSRGDSHREAVALLAAALADSRPSTTLDRLLSSKSLASYSADLLSDVRTTELVRQADRLVAAMERVLR